MKAVSSLFFACVIGLQTLSSHPLPYSREKMENFLDGIQDGFETRYAPYDWKVSEFGWDLNQQVIDAKALVRFAPMLSLADFQQIVRNLVLSSGDYHVGVYFYNTGVSFLPFTVKKAEGKYYVTSIQLLGSPLKKGDQIILWNDEDPDIAIEAMKKQLTSSNPLTDQSFAEYYLTKRVGALGLDLPKGRVKLKVLQAETGAIKTIKIRWHHRPNMIEQPPYAIKSGGRKKVTEPEDSRIPKMLLKSHLKEMLLNPQFAQIERIKKMCPAIDNLPSHPNDLGNFYGYLPPLGEIVWKNDSKIFNAYIFSDDEGRKIGYIRIPDYLAGGKGVLEFERLIKVMERDTEALVIDQMSNPGGSAFYLYALLSYLNEKPMYTPLHRLAITQYDLQSAVEVLDKMEIWSLMGEFEGIESPLDGYPVTAENVALIEEYCHFILEEWRDGNYITDPVYLFAIDKIQPQAVNYSKPLLVLVNELCLSCADFFAAILQDHGRAKTMGLRTAGAGGYIINYPLDNPFGIESISFTGSIAERSNGQKIEGVGVTPDIEYELSAEDLKGNYAPFVKAIKREVAVQLEEEAEKKRKPQRLFEAMQTLTEEK